MDSFLEAFAAFAGMVVDLLPKSPTVDSAALQSLSVYCGYINYFLPVGPYLTFLAAVLGCLMFYYQTMVLLRWLKVIA